MLNILPKDDRYFERFTDLAVRIREAAGTLDRFFQGQAPVSATAAEVKRLEHECDEISHEILRSIDQSFITPIDREDIHQLAVRLDDVMDLIDGTVRRVVLFQIDKPTPLSAKMSQLIVQASAELVEAVSQLRKQKGVMEHCIRIKKLENEADAAYGESIASLFRGQPNAIELIKWKEIYDTLEKTLDHMEDAGNVLESISIKHG